MTDDLIPQDPTEGAKARRDIVLSAYQSLQRRLDRYRQIGITTATAFVPILTFFISTAINIGDGIGVWGKAAFIAFVLITAGGAALFLGRLLRYFKELSGHVQRCEILVGMHQSGVFGQQPLLFAARFKPTSEDGTTGTINQIERPAGWPDPFIKMSIWAILIMGVLAAGIVAYLFFAGGGGTTTSG